MREYLFRGKRKDNGEWVYGYVRMYTYRRKLKAWIETIDRTWEVIPETVGEFTGLLAADSNRYTAGGEKDLRIFEGDIVEHTSYGERYEIVFISGEFVLKFDNDDNGRLISYIDDLEIIGNIHDTPELLGGERKEE
jgi:hypothetical protein